MYDSLALATADGQAVQTVNPLPVALYLPNGTVFALDANGNFQVVGNVASGAADSGNPVKAGGKYNLTLPTFADGQRGDLQIDSRGNLRISVLDRDGAIGARVNTQGDANSNALAGLVVLDYSYAFTGASWDRTRTPSVFKTIAAVAVTAATPVTVWTPGASKKFRVMGYALSLSVAGAVILLDNAAGAEIFRTPVMAAGIGQASPPLGNGFLSAVANNVLKIDVTASGTVQGFVYGTEE